MRSIIREQEFELAIGRLFRNDGRSVEEYLKAPEPVLILDPEIGTPLRDGYWILPLEPIGEQEVWLYYTFFETVVILVEVAAFT